MSLPETPRTWTRTNKRVAIVLPADVASIDDVQRAFGPDCVYLSDLVSASEFVEIDWRTEKAPVDSERERLREALEFYARGNIVMVREDDGAIAKEALLHQYNRLKQESKP